MKIEIDLDEMLYHGDPEEGPASLREQVLTMVVQRLVEDFKHSAISQEIAKQVREIVHANIDATVRTALAQPIQQTSRWGERQGSTTTVLEMARERLEDLLAAPATRDRGYNSSGKPSNLAELIDDVVKKELTTGELRAALEQAKKTVATRVESVMTEVITKALTVPIRK